MFPVSARSSRQVAQCSPVNVTSGRQSDERRRVAHAHCVIASEDNMEVFVSAPSFSFSPWMFPDESVVGDLLSRFTQTQVSVHTDQRREPGTNPPPQAFIKKPRVSFRANVSKRATRCSSLCDETQQQINNINTAARSRLY